jgi:hypothetical protein
MKQPELTIAGQPGCIFAGEHPRTFCFVPQEYLVAGVGGCRVSESDYVRSGWDVRNLRYNDETLGSHLFPDPSRPITDLNEASVRVFIRRINKYHG